MYNIAAYYRISVDDDIGNDESFSITNQRLFLSEYLKNKEDIGDHNITEYCDDGYTGTNFQRPQFRKMLQGISMGLINCIIVKDFSRFARNYVDITDYLCNYFPLNNIRFISVNDGFDSKYDGPTELNISFKNLMYDFYSKDISQKVRSSVYSLMKQGHFIASKPLYGYKIDNTGSKRKLVIDEESAKVVRHIFELLTDGYTPIEIANIFNDEKIPTPSQFRILKGYVKKNSHAKTFWSSQTVRLIAKNIEYTGKLVNAKTMVKEIGSTNHKPLPKEEHIITNNAHEPIITTDIYEKAQTCIKDNYKKFHKTSGHAQEYKPIVRKQLFTRKIKCAHCGYGMTYYRSNSSKYVCKNGKVGYSEKCNHAIAYEKEIENTVSAALNEYVKLSIDRATMKKAMYEKQKKQAELCKKQLAKLKKSLNSLKKIQVINYENYLDEKISRKAYEDKQAELDTEINKVNQQMEDINISGYIGDGAMVEDRDISTLERFIKNKENITLDYAIINELVKEVIVYSTDRFEIIWRFKDFFQK